MSSKNKKNENDSPNNSELDDPKVRRRLRAEFRLLQSNLEEQGEDAIKPDSGILHSHLEKLDDLFSRVRHPREAVQDSSLLLALTKKGREQVQQLKIDAVSFDNPTFAEKIISHVNGRHIDKDEEMHVNLNIAAWRKLGDRACKAFKNAPKVDFLLGPLVLEVVKKDKPQRNTEARKKNQEGSLVKLTQVETGGSQEEATTKEVERIYKILKKVTHDGTTNFDFFQFIINPQSFGQTVENLFHLSFLVKDGRVVVDLDEYGLPYINVHAVFNEEEHHGEGIKRKQVVLPLTMTEWQQLIEAYEITDSVIPTRDKIFR